MQLQRIIWWRNASWRCVKGDACFYFNYVLKWYVYLFEWFTKLFVYATPFSSSWIKYTLLIVDDTVDEFRAVEKENNLREFKIVLNESLNMIIKKNSFPFPKNGFVKLSAFIIKNLSTCNGWTSLEQAVLIISDEKC